MLISLTVKGKKQLTMVPLSLTLQQVANAGSKLPLAHWALVCCFWSSVALRLSREEGQSLLAERHQEEMSCGGAKERKALEAGLSASAKPCGRKVRGKKIPDVR